MAKAFYRGDYQSPVLPEPHDGRLLAAPTNTVTVFGRPFKVGRFKVGRALRARRLLTTARSENAPYPNPESP
jgi:hypothetical protein